MKLTEAYNIVNTEVPSVQLKRFIEHVGDMGEENEFSFVGEPKNTNTSKFTNILKKFMSVFPQMESDLRIEYLQKLIEITKVLDCYVPITAINNKIRFNDDVMNDGTLFVTELAQFVNNHNKVIEEKK